MTLISSIRNMIINLKQCSYPSKIKKMLHNLNILLVLFSINTYRNCIWKYSLRHFPYTIQHKCGVEWRISHTGTFYPTLKIA